jgi:predicted metalloprotease with PDZ domain
VDYESLVDSPFFAGRHFAKWDLGSNVTLNVVADDARFLKANDEQIGRHKALVTQAMKLFGTRQFDHYDLLLSLTEKMGGIGLEHHRSSENGVDTGYFTDWDRGPGRRNLLPHEFTHSWNGKHRRGADLVTPDFRTPMRNSMLWVYEGQTQFWGYVLQARSGLVKVEDTLDQLATIAATLDTPNKAQLPFTVCTMRRASASLSSASGPVSCAGRRYGVATFAEARRRVASRPRTRSARATTS